MKRILLSCILIITGAACHAQTQRFPNAVGFGTNVFLHDAPTVPLHTRVPTGTVMTGISSGDGSVTIAQSGTVFDVSVPATEISGWSGYPATQGVNIAGNYIVGGNAQTQIVSGSVGAYQIGANGSGLGTQYFVITNSLGAVQLLDLFGSVNAYIIGSDGARQRGYLYNGDITISNSAAAEQSLYFATDADASILSSHGAKQIGWMQSGANSSIFNSPSAIHLFSLSFGQVGYASNAASSIIVDQGRSIHTGAIVLGLTTSRANYSVNAVGGFFGNAAGLTNGPWLTQSSGETNFWRRTTAIPTNSAFAGSDGQRVIVWLSSTHAVERVYSGVSNLWLEARVFTTF